MGPGYSFEVDWWAFGALTFECLTGRPPFTANTIKALFQVIEGQELRIPAESAMSAEAAAIVQALLQKDPRAAWRGRRGPGPSGPRILPHHRLGLPAAQAGATAFRPSPER